MSMFNRIVLTFVGAAIALSVSPVVNAQVCSAKSLKGSFGYTVTGSIVTDIPALPASPVLIKGPFAAVGRITFDGQGGVTTVRSLSDNGVIFQHDAGSGTYSMNKDCTGSFTITVGPPSSLVTLSLDIVLDDTNQLRGVVTTTGAALIFEGRKQLPIIYF
jgi:hypothetical protein